jgi:hypothetical protein
LIRAIISSAFNDDDDVGPLAAHVLRPLEMLGLLHLDFVDGCLESIPYTAGGQVIDHSGQA